jgi:hypothetical protein
MTRPLYFDGSNTLQQMSDAQLDRLCYYLAVAYAAQLNAGGNGYVNLAATGTAIGGTTNQRKIPQTNTVTRIVNDGVIQTYPAYPGTATQSVASYAPYQQRAIPSAPSAATFNADGYVYTDGSNNLQVESTDAGIYAEVLAQTIADIRSGHEVGSYRVATSTPTSGGAGTWVSKGTFFQDTTYTAGTTTYNYYLKTGLTTVPGTNTYPVGIDTSDNNLKQRPITNSDPLVANVLLPMLTRRMSSGLYYSVASSLTGVNKGTFTDTYQTGVTNTQSFDGTYYRSTSTPSGSASVRVTKYFQMV